MTKTSTLDTLFPRLAIGREAIGPKIMFQLIQVPKTTKSGALFLPDKFREFEAGHVMIAKVLSVGKGCFHNKDGSFWAGYSEAAPPFKVGDIVHVPRLMAASVVYYDATGAELHPEKDTTKSDGIRVAYGFDDVVDGLVDPRWIEQHLHA